MISDIIKDLKNLNPDKKMLRSFSFLIIGLSLLFIIILYFKQGTFSILSAFIGGFAFFIAAMKPAFLRPFYFVWMTFALTVGWIITRAFLIIVFYVVMTPIGLLLRLLDKDILDQKVDSDSISYWKKKEEESGIEKYTRMF